MKIKDKSQVAVEKRRAVLEQAAKDCQQFCSLSCLTGVKTNLIIVDGVNNFFINLCYKVVSTIRPFWGNEIFSSTCAYYVPKTHEESKIVFNFSGMDSGFFNEQADFNDEKQIYFAFCHEFSHLLFKEFLQKDAIKHLNKKIEYWSEDTNQVINQLVSSYHEYEQKRDQTLAKVHDTYNQKNYDEVTKLLDIYERDKEEAKNSPVYNVGKFLKSSAEEAFADQMAVFLCSRVMSEKDLCAVLSGVINSRSKDSKESVGADFILKQSNPDVHNTNFALIKMFSDLYAVKKTTFENNLNFNAMSFEAITDYALANAWDSAGASVVDNYIKNPFFQDLFDQSICATPINLEAGVNKTQLSLFEDKQINEATSSAEVIKNLSISLGVGNKLEEVDKIKRLFRDFIDNKIMLNWPLSQEEIKEFIDSFKEVLKAPMQDFLDQSRYSNKDDYAKWIGSLQYIILTTVELFPDKEMNVLLNKGGNHAYLPQVHYNLFHPDQRDILKEEGLDLKKKRDLLDKIKSGYNSPLHKKVIHIK